MDTLLVADSFRVRVRDHGGVAEARMPVLHFERFRTGVAEALDDQPDEDWWELVFEPFMETVPAQIAEGGAGFPRIELRDAGDSEPVLDLRIRPLPRLTTRIELRTAPGVRLITPRLKGPNIPRLAELNRGLGAEALLIDDAGSAVEGATTSLLWWDGGTLCAVASEERVLSVTELLVLSIAAHRGIPVEMRSCTPKEITAHEVWALNALHGIRKVTGIDGVSTGTPRRGRLADFRDALEDTWQAIDSRFDDELDDEADDWLEYGEHRDHL